MSPGLGVFDLLQQLVPLRLDGLVLGCALASVLGRGRCGEGLERGLRLGIRVVLVAGAGRIVDESPDVPLVLPAVLSRDVPPSQRGRGVLLGLDQRVQVGQLGLLNRLISELEQQVEDLGGGLGPVRLQGIQAGAQSDGEGISANHAEALHQSVQAGLDVKLVCPREAVAAQTGQDGLAVGIWFECPALGLTSRSHVISEGSEGLQASKTHLWNTCGGYGCNELVCQCCQLREMCHIVGVVELGILLWC